MKALTLTQPWASLVAIGAKQWETRSWSTTYRGQLAIHAAKGFPAEARLLTWCEPFKGRLAEHPFYLGENRLPLGAVVAICDLIQCRRTEDTLMGLEPEEISFGDYTPGRWCFQLVNIHRLPEPIPAKGALGLWEWQQP